MHDPDLFGRWLARRRKALDLTQRELAGLVGCSTATVRKLEADERRPSRRTATSLARVLGIDDVHREAFVAFARSDGAGVGPPESALGPTAWPPSDIEAESGTVSAPDPRARSAPSRTGSAERFVARREEMTELDAALERALDGEASVRLVAGEAGQGKSALLRAFVGRALQRHRDLAVFTGACNAYVGAGDPFLPFRQILGQMLGDGHAAATGDLLDTVRAARALRVVPVARRVLREHGTRLVDGLVPASALGGGGPVPAQGDQLPAIENVPTEEARRSGIGTLIAQVARERPIVLVIDDLQWVDRSSAETLLHLGRTFATEKILVMGAFRPAEIVAPEGAHAHALEVVIDELEHRKGRMVIDLADADARAFLEGYLDSEPNDFDAVFRDALWRQTGGQPLLTVELLRHLQEREAVVRYADGRWHVAGEIAWDEVPDRVAGALARRLARVDAEAIEVLQVAAVEGSVFTPEVVARALDKDIGLVARRLADLEARHRLIEDRSTPASDARPRSHHRFRHDLIQRFVYDGLSNVERRHLHGRVADALEALEGDRGDPGVLAHHLRHGPEPERAAGPLRRAGDRARRAGALEEAILLYRDADAAARAPDTVWRAGLLTSIGECLWLRGRLKEAYEALREARRGYIEVGDRHGSGTVELTMARVLYAKTDRERAMDMFHHAFQALQHGPESAVLARAASSISQLHMIALEGDEAVEWGERALAIAERVGAEDVVVHAWNNIGSALAFCFPERRDQGIELVRRSLVRARELGLVHDSCRAAFNLGNHYADSGEWDRALDVFEELRSYAARHQVFTMEGGGALSAWTVRWRTGRWIEALRDRPVLQRFAAVAEPESSKENLIVLALASAQLDLGRPQEAWRLLRPQAAAFERVSELQSTIPYRRERLRYAVAVGDGEAAARAADALADVVLSSVPRANVVLQALRDLVRWWTRPEASASSDRVLEAVAVLIAEGGPVGPAESEAARFEGRAFRARFEADHGTEAAGVEAAAAAWNAAELLPDEAQAWYDAARAWDCRGEIDRAARARGRGNAVVELLAAQLPEPRDKADLWRRFAGAAPRSEGTGGRSPDPSDGLSSST